MTGQKMKISELAADIERVMADPTTKFWIKGNRKYYFLRTFPLDNLESAGRCMAIIQTIIGYNVKQAISSKVNYGFWSLRVCRRNRLHSHRRPRHEIQYSYRSPAEWDRRTILRGMRDVLPVANLLTTNAIRLSGTSARNVLPRCSANMKTRPSPLNLPARTGIDEPAPDPGDLL